MRVDHTILVVDDHPPALYAASKLLQKAGFKTLEASNGEDAMELASRVSAVLMDVNLPDINGVEVCYWIKATCSKPIILMSAVFVDSLHREAAARAGADSYLALPLDEHELISELDRLLP